MPQYDEIEIEDMTYDPETLTYSYPCPCGDRFKVSLEDLWDGEDIADCNSCTLYIQVIYEQADLPPLPNHSDDEEDSGDNKDTIQKSDQNDVNPRKEEEKNEDPNPSLELDSSKAKDMTLDLGKLSLTSSLDNECRKQYKSAVAAWRSDWMFRSKQGMNVGRVLVVGKKIAWPANRVVHSSHSLIRLTKQE
jgi:diphthamide biosynthesis protein 3